MRRKTGMVEEGGYSICKCRFRFELTFRSLLPWGPAIEAPSFQTVNKWPAKRHPKSTPPPLGLYFLLLNCRDNLIDIAPLIPRHILVLAVNWPQHHFIYRGKEVKTKGRYQRKRKRKEKQVGRHMECRLCVIRANDDRRNVGESCYRAKRDRRGIRVRGR